MSKEYVVRIPFTEVEFTEDGRKETRFEPGEPYNGSRIDKHLKGDVNLGPRIVEKPAAAGDEKPAGNDAPAEAAPEPAAEKSTGRRAGSTTKEN